MHEKKIRKRNYKNTQNTPIYKGCSPSNTAPIYEWLILFDKHNSVPFFAHHDVLKTQKPLPLVYVVITPVFQDNMPTMIPLSNSLSIYCISRY